MTTLILEETEEQNIIHDILMDFGVSPHLSGYAYISYAITLLARNTNLDFSVTKDIYPQVAKHFRTTPSRVERCIRHAIEVAYAATPISVHHKYFGNSVGNQAGRPTNTKVLSGLTLFLLRTRSRQ